MTAALNGQVDTLSFFLNGEALPKTVKKTAPVPRPVAPAASHAQKPRRHYELGPLFRDMERQIAELREAKRRAALAARQQS